MTFEETFILTAQSSTVHVVSHDLQSRQSMSQSKVAAEGVDFAKVFNHCIKDYCKLFTNFVFLKNYIFIAHGHILSFYDILLKRFNDHHLEFKSDIEQVFRSKSPNTNEFVICVLLKNGDLEFLRS